MREKSRIRTVLGLTSAMAVCVAGWALPAGASAANSNFQGINASGTKIWFQTTDQLVPADTDLNEDVYERSAGITTLITPGSGSASFQGASDDGTRVFFTTSEALIPATDTDSSNDIYMRNSASPGTPVHISRGAVGGNGAFNAIFEHVNASGTEVIFRSDEMLVSGDSDSDSGDLYLRDIAANTTSQVSLPESGHTPTNPATDVNFAAYAPDTGYVFMRSTQDLDDDDTDSSNDIFRRSATDTSLTSREDATSGVNGDGAFSVTLCGVSSDGDKAFFRTAEVLSTDGSIDAHNDGDDEEDIYVRNIGDDTFGASLQTDGSESIDAASCVNNGSATSDGGAGFFQSSEEFIGANAGEADGNDTDVLRFEPDYGDDITPNPVYASGEGDGRDAGIQEVTGSGPGMVIYVTDGADSGLDTDSCGGIGCDDVYSFTGFGPGLRSTSATDTDTPEHASFAASANNGSQVLFDSGSQLSPGDGDIAVDTYMNETVPSTTTHISSGAGGINGDQAVDSLGRAIANGHFVFATAEPLVAADIDLSVDVYELIGGSTVLVSREAKPPVTTVTNGPGVDSGSTTNDTTPTFGFSADENATFQCAFDSGTFAACSGTNTHTPASPLNTGAHTFKVFAIDAAGNCEGDADCSSPVPQQVTFSVDPNFNPPPTTTVPAENPECAVLRAKLAKLNKRIKQADDPDQKAKLKKKRRKVRAQLKALGC